MTEKEITELLDATDDAISKKHDSWIRQLTNSDEFLSMLFPNLYPKRTKEGL